VSEPASPVVVVSEAGFGKLAQRISIQDRFTISADEPERLGGTGTGATPYDLLLAALGACTSMTLRLYAERKGIPLRHASVTLSHDKIHAVDCQTCETREGKLDRIERVITLDGDLDAEQRQKLLEIADKCPVHRTLMSEISIVTRLAD
jgi:putative redox protein